MKLDLAPPAVRRTAARIIAPDPAQAGRRPLAAALRSLDHPYDHVHPYHRAHLCGHAHGHPHDHPHLASAAAHTRTHEGEV
ncbi:hypothetical protein [Streptomyces similanensis]|uniref:Uncharacterized protein n=1 Tax=Streptomyces similanensis TaxID=1274988 RepID=A0ABP9LPH6_9ACTN